MDKWYTWRDKEICFYALKVLDKHIFVFEEIKSFFYNFKT